jgi:hypothetical protein
LNTKKIIISGEFKSHQIKPKTRDQLEIPGLISGLPSSQLAFKNDLEFSTDQSDFDKSKKN